MVGIGIQPGHVQHKEVMLLSCSVIMRRQIHDLSDMLMKQLLITLIGLRVEIPMFFCFQFILLEKNEEIETWMVGGNAKQRKCFPVNIIRAKLL